MGVVTEMLGVGGADGGSHLNRGGQQQRWRQPRGQSRCLRWLQRPKCAKVLHNGWHMCNGRQMCNCRQFFKKMVNIFFRICRPLCNILGHSRVLPKPALATRLAARPAPALLRTLLPAAYRYRYHYRYRYRYRSFSDLFRFVRFV